jgi:hypothetical protein
MTYFLNTLSVLAGGILPEEQEWEVTRLLHLWKELGFNLGRQEREAESLYWDLHAFIPEWFYDYDVDEDSAADRYPEEVLV